MTSIIIDSHPIIDSNKVPKKKQLLKLDGPNAFSKSYRQKQWKSTPKIQTETEKTD